MTATAAPDPVAAATTMANEVGGEVVSTALGVWPALVGALLTLSVIGGVAAKFKLRRSRGVL